MEKMMVKMDAATRNAIVRTVREAVTEAMETTREEWVTGDELCRRCSMITKSWLKQWGYLVPRERIEVTDKEGGVTATRWGYPLHKILRLVMNHELRYLEDNGRDGQVKE